MSKGSKQRIPLECVFEVWGSAKTLSWPNFGGLGHLQPTVCKVLLHWLSPQNKTTSLGLNLTHKLMVWITVISESALTFGWYFREFCDFTLSLRLLLCESPSFFAISLCLVLDPDTMGLERQAGSVLFWGVTGDSSFQSKAHAFGKPWCKIWSYIRSGNYDLIEL